MLHSMINKTNEGQNESTDECLGIYADLICAPINDSESSTKPNKKMDEFEDIYSDVLCSPSEVAGETKSVADIDVDDFPVAKQLLRLGADVNAKTYSLQTCLHLAVASGNHKFLHFLLENGANPNVRDDGAETPLMLAIRVKDFLATQILIKGGAKTGLFTRTGCTDLFLLINTFREDARVLVSPDVNLGKFDIIEAILMEDPELIELLKEFGGKTVEYQINRFDDSD